MTRRALVRSLLVVLATALLGVGGGAGCYRPAFEDCTLACGPAALCPDALTCVAGVCRVDPLAPTCGSLVDASLVDPEDGALADGALADAAPGTADAQPGVIDAGPSLPDADPSCMCDPLAQSCCAPTDACDVTAGQAACREVSTGGAQASICTSPTQCSRGYTCLAPSGALGTSCHEFCDADGDCAGQGGFCDRHAASSPFKACTTSCNPLTGGGCTSGWACSVRLNQEGVRWHTDCRPAGAGQQGTTCIRDDDCGLGFICVNGSPAQCARVCKVGEAGGSACPGTPTCTSLGGAVIAGVEYGACL